MRSIIALLLLVSSMQVKAQQPDSVKVFIDSALNSMQRNSVYAGKLNWKAIRDSAYAMSRNASTYMEAAPGIKYAFNALGDKHGWLVFKDEEYRNPAFKPDTGRISLNIKQAALKGGKIYSGIVKHEYAYISIPFFGGQTPQQVNAFAQRIQDSLFNQVNENTKGIIIDLRLNAGGNMYPMFAGLVNVFGETDFAIYPTAIKDSVERSSITNKGIEINGQLVTPSPKTYGDLSAHPVAVIIGPVTGSSGECLAAGFVGRKNTVLIGEATAGYTTANDGFRLPGGDYGMVLAVGYLRDRYGNVYHENVKPNITVTAGDDFFNRENDKKIQAAMNWILAQTN